ncbi:MAG: GAF domain-containing protein [Erysipelotrichaceae bacterium]|nr:GAF domain-containing protein [Erysipelotrichaceae bacterium]
MTDYKIMTAQLEALSESSRNYIPLLSNASALINGSMKDLNWAGFYIVRDGALLLGPFQGKTACVNIAKGKGVCGTAYERDETQLVKNVHEFPGHIACDSASNSEIVVPIHAQGSVVAVLDIDSPLLERFDENDKEGLEAFVRKLEELIKWE